MLRIGRLSVPGLIFYVVVIGALVVGLALGGGTGNTIASIAAAVLALTILGAAGGFGVAARDRVDRRGRR